MLADRFVLPYGHNMTIWLCSFMASTTANMGVYGKSNKNVAIWSRDWIDWTVRYESQIDPLAYFPLYIFGISP